jgi:alkylhydroperoxidase family enzyme
MAKVLEQIAWEGCLFEPQPDPALERYAKQRMGIVPPGVEYFGAVPWIARLAIELHPEQGLLMHLPQRSADLLVLVVSQENSCRYCYAAARAMLWLQGMKRERILRIEQDAADAGLDPRLRQLLEFGRIQSRRGPDGARAAWAALRRCGMGRDELMEAAFIVALTDLSNRLNSIPAIPTHMLERLPGQWHVRLLRPLMGRMLRARQRRGQTAAAPTLGRIPYAGLVQAYAGSPIAGALALVLQGMWSSPVLTQRCKLLLLAVVARGLPCAVCELDLTELLEAAGLPRAASERLLAQLHGPELTPTEALLLPLARETLWYEPAQLQRRARELRGRIGDAELLEAIGVAAIGNGLSRMAAVVREDPR